MSDNGQLYVWICPYCNKINDGRNALVGDGEVFCPHCYKFTPASEWTKHTYVLVQLATEFKDNQEATP